MDYLSKIKHTEIIYFNNIIQFLYNKKNLNIKDKTSVGEFFLNDINPIIQVIDPKNLLLKEPILKYRVTFKTTSGEKDTSEFYIYYDIGILISNYLDFKEHPELENKKELINFLYNAKQINEKESLYECFKSDFNPVILVMDPNNLLSKQFQNEQNKKMNIIFKTSNDTRLILCIKYGTTIDRLLKLYLWKRGENERGKKFIFSFNAKLLIFGEQIFVEKVLKDYDIVIVNDIRE